MLNILEINDFSAPELDIYARRTEAQLLNKDNPELMQEEKLAIILGTEGEGLMDRTIEMCDYTVKIPMSHDVDSLNVAAASAVAFWQLAKKWLDANHISYEERHIVEENPTYEELKQWYENGDLPLKKFFNTSGMLYKEQKLKDKLPDMSEEDQLRLLATNGMLVKRPLIVKENLVLTGFKEKEWTEKLL